MKFLLRLPGAAGLLLALCGYGADSSPPNLLLVVADDLGLGDLACFGNPEIQTPHLNALANSGMKLTRCYSASPVCSPARAAIMTGRNPYRVGVYSQIPMMCPMHLRDSEVTIAALLRHRGYATAQFGKWHLNGLFNLPGQPQPNDMGFDYWFSVQNVALPNHHDPYNFVLNGIPQGPIAGYSGGIVADHAIDWLVRIRDKSRPFFLYVAFNEPHEPIATEPRFQALYRRNHPDDPSCVDYYGNVTQLDESLGRILQALDDQGLRDNTLVWFTSDNGPARTKWHNVGSAGGLRGYKGHLYEGGLRVPGIIRWPGHIRPGSESDQPVSGMDFLPTVCDVTGVPPPADRAIDGASFLPAFNGNAVQRSKPIFWEFIWSISRPQVALVQGNWKLLAAIGGPRRPLSGDYLPVDYRTIKTNALSSFELYDLKRDPRETTNLVTREPAAFKSLRAAMEQIHAEVCAQSPDWPTFVNPNYDGPRIIWPDYVAKPLPPDPSAAGPIAPILRND